MTRFRKAPRMMLGFLFLFVSSGGFSLAQAKGSKLSRDNSATGRSTYNTSCAGCHGLDGHGSDKAVNIASGSEVRHLSETQLSNIIANGIPGTGMPAFRTLPPKQIGEVARYLRSLQGKGQVQTVSGDAQRGKEIFFGKGECSSCHTISGQGGFLAPDLSTYASSSSAQAIHDEIVLVQRNPAPGYRAGVLTTNDGEQFEGLIRNEDNFSVQLQTKDGSFHFFQRSALRKFERLETSLMPTNYGERLTPQEIDALVSFVINACPDAIKSRPSHRKEYEDE